MGFESSFLSLTSVVPGFGDEKRERRQHHVNAMQLHCDLQCLVISGLHNHTFMKILLYVVTFKQRLRFLT